MEAIKVFSVRDVLPAVYAARKVIGEHVRQTPLDPISSSLWLKREDLQVSGSFKMRGVANAVLGGDDLATGLVCSSTGNTGVALCELSHRLRIPAWVYVTSWVSLAKVKLLEELGATVVVCGESFAEASQQGRSFAHDRGFLFCSPGADWPFCYGVGTIALELIEARIDFDQVLLPVGGGGLATGVGAVLKAETASRECGVVGVQSVGSPFVFEHFYYGRVLTARTLPTVADSLMGDPETDAKIYDVDRMVLSAVELVTDGEIELARNWLADYGIHVDAGAAASVAAYLRQSPEFRAERRTCIVLTGKDRTLP